MQAARAQIAQALSPLLSRSRQAANWLFGWLGQVWRRLDAIDIPLSPLQWILLFYLAFGGIYLLTTPAFEAHDELWHFGYVQRLRETGNLPVQVFDGKDTAYQQHGSQPPLYYGLAALLTSPINIDEADSYRRLNPHVREKQPTAYGNKNLILRDADLAPWAGAALALLLLRGLGLALGAGTVYCVYKIGELIAPQRPTVAFVAAALTGLNPMFIFVSASVNNDALAMLLNGCLVLLMLRGLRDGFQPRRSLAIALLFALTSLTKLTGLVLLPVLLGVALFSYRKTKDRRGLLLFVAALAFCWLLIAGWWFARNIQLYSEPFGIITMANIAGPRGPTFSLATLFEDFQQFRMAYWGLFGAQNIPLGNIIYLLLDLMLFFSVLGGIFLILQLLAISDFAYARYELAHLLTLLSALVLLWLAVLYFSTLTRAPDGRMLFPLIAVISPLLAVCFVEIVWWVVFSLRPPNLEFVRAGDAVPKELLHNTMLWQLRFLGLVAFFAPLTVIASQYSPPQPVLTLPDTAQSVYAEFGDVALIAYERVDRRYAAGDRVRLKLYWQVLQQSTADNSLLLTLVDDNQQEIGHYSTYPGAGKLRTSKWQAGAIYPDEYIINISKAAYGRYPFDLQVEWENLPEARGLPAQDAAGAPIAPVLLDVGAVVSARYADGASGFNEIEVDAQPVFDDVIRLEAFLLDLARNEVILSWKAEGQPEENYTVFAHILGEQGEILSQADAPPRLPTKYWHWGEAYTTQHQFPAEFNMLEHQVIVGLYLNDGLTYPKAEYVVTAAVEATAAAPGEPEAEEIAEPAEPVEPTESLEQEETEVVLDFYTLDLATAQEVLALTPAPTEEGETEADAES